MKTEIEKINSVQHRIKVSVPVDTVNKAFDKAFQGLRTKVELKGFRRGKAPLAMIKKIYGEHVSANVGEDLIKENLPGAMRDNLETNKDLKPVSAPMLEEPSIPEMDKEFSFAVILDVFPEIKLDGKHKNIKVEIPTFEAKTSDVDKHLEYLRRQQATTKTVEVAEDGNQVKFDIESTLDGEAFESETGQDRMVILGQNHIFADLESKFKGAKAGDSITADVTLPDDYQPEEFKGKTIQITAQVKEVQQIDTPELDDEFAKDLGHDDVTALKKKVAHDIEHRLMHQKENAIDEQCLNYLRDNIEFEAPPAIVDRVIDSMFADVPFPDPKQKEKLMQDPSLRERMKPNAITKAKNSLLLVRISEEEKVEVTEEEMRKEVVHMFSHYGNDKPEDKAVNDYLQKNKDHLEESLLLKLASKMMRESAEISIKDPEPEKLA